MSAAQFRKRPGDQSRWAWWDLGMCSVRVENRSRPCRGWTATRFPLCITSTVVAGDAQLQDLPHQGMGNAVEALVHLDVVVDAGLRLAPLGVRVVVLGQRLERRPVQGLEQVLAALGASLEGAAR